MLNILHGDEGRFHEPRPEAERIVKIEQLLLSGLDHYIKGRYERAIDVWTRVLFLDRTHARARAYIDRARAALAEKLRESEELLPTGVEAFNRGDVNQARELLTTAVESGGGRDDALTLLDRMTSLETAAGQEAAVRGGSQVRGFRPGRRNSVARQPLARQVRVLPLVLLVVVVVVSGYVALSWDQWPLGVLNHPVRVLLSPSAVRSDALPVPSAAAVVLVRAERLAGEGRHQDALRLVATIEPSDPLTNDADALRTTIQRELLAPVAAEPATEEALNGPG